MVHGGRDAVPGRPARLDEPPGEAAASLRLRPGPRPAPRSRRRAHRRLLDLRPVALDFDAIYRAESRRVFATLVRLLGDFDLAEEALAEAFRAALEQWPREGVPANPRAWLVSAGRFKAI